MKKRIYSLLLTCALALSITACGDKEVEDNFSIKTEEIAVIDYGNLEYEKITIEEPTDDEIKQYIQYMVEEYENSEETKIENVEEMPEEVIKVLTSDEAKTMDELKEYAKEILSIYNKDTELNKNLDLIYSILNEKSILKDYDENELKEYKEYEEEYFKALAATQELEFEKYKTNILKVKTEEEYNKYLEDAALKTLKADIIIKEIAKKENITVSEKEYEDYLSESMFYYGYENEEDLLKVYSQEQLKLDIMYDKVLSYIYSLY